MVGAIEMVQKHEIMLQLTPNILSAHKFYKALRVYIVKTLYETIHLRRICTELINQMFEHTLEICFTIDLYKLETGQGEQ